MSAGTMPALTNRSMDEESQMVTEVQVAAAEAAVEKAEAALDAAEQHHASVGSPQAVAELRGARGVAHGARDNLRRLRARWAADQAAMATRTAAEEKFAPAAPGMVKELGKARDAAVQAVAAAEEAITRALSAAAVYDEKVREASRDLRSRGLRADDGEEMGGRRDGGLHLDGELWLPVDGAGLIAAVVAGVVAGHSPRHPVATWRPLGGLPARAGQAELLARVPAR